MTRSRFASRGWRGTTGCREADARGGLSRLGYPTWAAGVGLGLLASTACVAGSPALRSGAMMRALLALPLLMVTACANPVDLQDVQVIPEPVDPRFTALFDGGTRGDIHWVGVRSQGLASYRQGLVERSEGRTEVRFGTVLIVREWDPVSPMLESGISTTVFSDPRVEAVAGEGISDRFVAPVDTRGFGTPPWLMGRTATVDLRPASPLAEGVFSYEAKLPPLPAQTR